MADTPNALIPKTIDVAIFIEDLGGGGAEKITMLLANGLAAHGYLVDLILQNPVGPFLTLVAPAVRVLSINNKRKLLSLCWLTRYLRQNEPRVLVTEMEKASLLGIVAGIFSGYKNIFPCVHIDLASYNHLDHRFRRNVLKLLVAVFYRFARGIIAVSERPATSIRGLLGSSPTSVTAVQNGFDLEELRQLGSQSANHRWLVQKDRPVFIACGRLVYQKGYDIMLRAFAKLRQEREARLIILGDGPLLGQMTKLADDLGIRADVNFAGFVANPLAWFTKADGFLMSSRSEGLSSVLIEALTVGCKIISTDCLAGPSEILDHGRFGRLVPVDDPAALAQAMADLLANRNNPPGDAAALATHLRQFSLDMMVQGYIRVLGLAAPTLPQTQNAAA